ncbi:MAG: hypothetical protein HN919_21050 [Verrucomicrobia bacterium]|jgi:hypothetical protein|nr:hypothetical protein [Verrucomicrobiota bacterium]MBT7068796.1 hypothetical protein [Verrucomicrobiota bacterium]MBT7700456.1 hypothetical protein [Verrucomicrobiota bacterium]
MLTRAMDVLIRGACLLALLLALLPAAFGAAPVPAAEMAALQAASQKARAGKPGSAEQRRACKRVVRGGDKLLESHPDDPKRFQLLGMMLQNQKVVLTLERTDRNREVLYDICTQLMQAPDEWAGVRLEADLLLSERDQSNSDASLEERAEALEALIIRYRGTSAEPKSLMIGATIAKDLDSGELDYFIERSMDERCAGNPEVIAFRRNVLSLKSLAVKCKGSYQRSDGTTLYIPGDRIGHQCLLVYWSQESSGIERFMQQVKEQQELFPGAFEVYSFNLDELPDAGEKVLRKMGLDWHAMHLPEGERNVAYQAYGGANPNALFVNAFGYTVLNPFGVNPDSNVGVMSLDGGIFKISEARLSHDRYLAQLQSLFIGDFLVADPVAPNAPSESLALGESGLQGSGLQSSPRSPSARPAGAEPNEILRAIQACFTPPPFRYRLTREEAMANYQRAEKLCGEAIKQHANAPELWLVRNRRIIALLGMWNLACDPAHLEQAVQEANTVLAAKVSPAEGVVARFCLAKASFREEGPHAEREIRQLVEASGGDAAPASALAAAAILALEANSRELHEEYRTRTLALLADSAHPMWGVRSFLLNRYHRFYLLKPNSTRGDRMGWSRAHIVNHGWNTNAVPFPKCELKNLDGSALSLPDDTEGRLTLLLFIEPPPESEADFAVVQGKKGFVPKYVFQLRDYVRGVVSSALSLADQHVNKEVDVRLAFLTDDAQRVERLMKTNEWSCAAAMVPGGLDNPMVQQLGILSADRLPNVFLLRRDGTVAWHCSGLVYKSEFGFPFAVTLAMKVHIEISDIQLAYRALTAGDYTLAARTFAGPFLPFLPERYGWRAPRHHGGALAQMALKDWDGALECIDKAIDARKLRYYRGRRSKGIEHWRKDAATVTVKEPDDILTELWAIKAIILEALGRKDEAAQTRRRSQQPAREEHLSIYKQFHEQLNAWRLAHEER